MELLRQDSDTLFSYSTQQVVKIRDSRLGLTYYVLNALILAYIIGYVFIYCEAWYAEEQAKGFTVTQVSGSAVSRSTVGNVHYFDEVEITYPGLENGNVFIATRISEELQKHDVCADPTMPCESDDDCSASVEGRCNEHFLCEEPSWCPESQKEVFDIKTSDMRIWIKSSIQFIKLAPEKIFSTELDHSYPEMGYNTYTVKDLLMMCEPVAVRYEEISELGAAIEVAFIWDCDVDSTRRCRPTTKVRRVDTVFDPERIGFAFNSAEYYSDDERLLKRTSGVRIFIRTVGRGRKLSVTATILQLSLNLSVLGLAEILVEVMMRKVFSMARIYIARKYDVSPNFTDFLDRAKKQDQTREALPEKQKKADMEADEDEQKFRRKLDEEDDED